MSLEQDFNRTAIYEPLVSIIVPVRNMENTIRRTIDSIVGQSYKKIEIVVIDGNSDDKTLKELERFDNTLDTIISEPDLGLYDAINKGLSRCTGMIIAILNGDDYYSHSGVVELYVKKFQKPHIGIVFGDLEFFPPGNPEKTVRTYSSRAFEPVMLQQGWMPPHPTTFVRKSVYDTVGLYQTDYEISADFEFLVRALWKHSVCYDRVDSVVVRMQYGGLSTAGLRATIILNKEIIRACKVNGLDTSWLKLLPKFPKKLLEFLPSN